MTSDDLKRIFLGPTLFRLDMILSPRLVPILYATGLVGILIWAINHLFFTFGTNFGNGLWGLVEIVVFGLLALIVLRIACEALLVFFKTHEPATDALSQTRIGSTRLLEDVRDAIHDLAEAENDTIEVKEPVHKAPNPPAGPVVVREPVHTATAPAAPVVVSEPVHTPTAPGDTTVNDTGDAKPANPRRTAKRTPPVPPTIPTE